MESFDHMHNSNDFNDFFEGGSCGMPQMPTQTMNSSVTRQVTPPAFAPPQNQITFDYNADYPQGPAFQPPSYEEFAPHPCDALKQRVWDEATGQFYKATCLLLEHSSDRAYWLQQQIRKAMFGVVWVGQELQRPEAFGLDANITHWETTGRMVAIKQASLQLLQQAEQLNSAEHPRREHGAMQHIFLVSGGAFESPASAMERTGVILPQDWLADEHYCYLVMPYCNGGELFDRVGNVGRFTEDEAKHWMHQILNSLETLHNAGVAHRDLSLENVMIHNDKAVIIDLGMSLPIPFDQNGQRRLIAPQGAAGKLKYMAPEVYSSHNQEGFDGFAVDMWACGVIMYIMLTGEVPWQMPDPSDVKFQKFTDGWIEPYLLQQGYPLSANALCLLQRMLWLNPRDRLCIQQIRAHPWMQMGGGGPQPIIRWRSTNRDSKKEEGEDVAKESAGLKVVKPGEIKSGRYSKDDAVSPEDMTVMLETVQKYTRDEASPEEEIAPAGSKVLSDDDSYVIKMREAMKKKKAASQA